MLGTQDRTRREPGAGTLYCFSERMPFCDSPTASCKAKGRSSPPASRGWCAVAVSRGFTSSTLAFSRSPGPSGLAWEAGGQRGGHSGLDPTFWAWLLSPHLPQCWGLRGSTLGQPPSLTCELGHMPVTPPAADSRNSSPQRARFWLSLGQEQEGPVPFCLLGLGKRHFL